MSRAVALGALLVAATVSGSASAQVVGRVADAETGAPVVGAAVVAQSGGARVGRATDADGRFTLDVLPGPATLAVTAVGYAQLDTAVTVPPSGALRLALRLAPTVTETAAALVQARRAETATRADAPVLLVPQSVAVVPRAVLAAQGARDTRDALRNVPGAQVAAEGEPGGAPVLRGFETDQTGGGVRRNGVEVPSLSDGLRANVARVEVLRGPASVLYGRLEPGGVVNVITERPRAERHVEAEASGSALGSGALVLDAGGALAGGPVTGLDVRVIGAAERDGWARARGDDLLLAPSLRVRRPSLTLVAEAEAIASETQIDPGLAAFGPATAATLDGVPRDRLFGEPTARHRWRALGAFTSAEWAARPDIEIRGEVALTRSTLRRDALDLTGAIGADSVGRALQRESLGFTYLKATAFADVRAQTGPVAHAVTVGAEGLRAWAQADGTAPLASDGAGGLTFASVAPVALETPAPTGLDADEIDYLDASVRGLDLGLFVQDRATLRLGGGALHAVASARLSHVRADAAIRALADTPDAPAGLSERAFRVTALTPAAGIVAELRPGLALYVSTGASFNPIVERVDRDGEPFAPTRGIQVEGGVKADRAWGSAAVSAFWIRKDDALTRGPGGFFEQTGRQRSRGLEAEVTAAPASGVTVLASYALTDAVVVADDNVPAGTPLPYAPRHAASAWAEVQRGAWALRGGVWLRAQRPGALAGDLTLPADAVADVGTSLDVGRGVALRLDARNVLGARGYSAGETRGEADALVVAWPIRPRELRLGVVVR